MVKISCRAVVMDIEGTTSAARHVYDVLFPYARSNMRAWLLDHQAQPATAAAIDAVASLLGVDRVDLDAVATGLEEWIDADVKVAPLKTLQGLIWEQGYARGELTSHIFEDVPPALRTWRAAGLLLAIYSSGSVTAQRALFANADQGDLNSLIDANFDITTAGPKCEALSYEHIAELLKIPARDLLFLSDVQAELDAASEAGWQTVGILRAGESQATVSQESNVSTFGYLVIQVVC